LRCTAFDELARQGPAVTDRRFRLPKELWRTRKSSSEGHRHWGNLFYSARCGTWFQQSETGQRQGTGRRDASAHCSRLDWLTEKSASSPCHSKSAYSRPRSFSQTFETR